MVKDQLAEKVNFVARIKVDKWEGSSIVNLLTFTIDDDA